MFRSFLRQTPNPVSVLEVEVDLGRVEERVKQFLIDNCPSLVWMPDYAKAIRWRSLSFGRGEIHLRGLATGGNRNVMVKVNRATRWMVENARSAVNAEEDLSPSGILCHELGHHFDWAVQDIDGGQEIVRQFHELPRKDAVSGYGRTNGQEDLAEAYRLYITNPHELRLKHSARFVLIQSMAERLETATGFQHDTYLFASPPMSAEQKLRRLNYLVSKGTAP